MMRMDGAFVEVRKASKITVLYGTETGTAVDIAKYVCRLLHCYAFRCLSLMSMDNYHDQVGMQNLPGEGHSDGLVIFIVSTTGDGEMPPTMERFWKVLLRKDLPLFPSDKPFNFAIFGLGDSSYQKFNAAGRKLGARLLQLQAREVCPRGYGDDQSEKGVWGDLDSWLPKLWGYLDAKFPLPPDFVLDASPKMRPCKYRVEAAAPPRPSLTQEEPPPPEEETVPAAVTGGGEPVGTAVWAAVAPPAARLRRRRPLPPPPPSSAAGEDAPPTAPASAVEEGAGEGDLLAPLAGRLVCNRRLTAQEWAQDVRHLEIEIPFPVDYAAGDVAVLCPENDAGKVATFLASQGIDPESELSISINPEYRPLSWEESQLGIPSNSSGGGTAAAAAALDLPRRCTAAALFGRWLDLLGTPRRDFFERLSLYAKDNEEKEKLLELASSEGADLLHDYCTREKRTYAEVLGDFPSCKLGLSELASLIKRLPPRSYSIASSSLVNPCKVDLCVAVVEYLTRYRRKVTGICSSWLANLEEGALIHLWVRQGTFVAPPDLESPMILVGPGTGVAPMRALLQERRQALLLGSRRRGASPGGRGEGEGGAPPGPPPPPAAAAAARHPDWLFFGCRYRDKDFLYEEEWAAMGAEKKKGTESNLQLELRCAFSRESMPKVYVTHRIEEAAASLCGLLWGGAGAHVYVSGSAKQMPGDVWAAFRAALLCQRPDLTEDQAERALKLLRRRGRYHVEAWS